MTMYVIIYTHIQDVIKEFREGSPFLIDDEENILLTKALDKIELAKTIDPAEGEIYVMEANVARMGGMEDALLVPILRRYYVSRSFMSFSHASFPASFWLGLFLFLGHIERRLRNSLSRTSN
jgi:hypothetical protein